MSIFRSIMSKIFGRDAAAEAGPQPTAPDPNASGAANASSAATAAAIAPPASVPPSGPVAPVAPAPPTSTPVAPSVAAAAAAPVDVAAVLTDMAAKDGRGLKWRQSIVDLMKLLGLDSSLTARKALASELGYEGDPADSAAMNIWLHKQVMKKLAENGGKVPADLTD